MKRLVTSLSFVIIAASFSGCNEESDKQTSESAPSQEKAAEELPKTDVKQEDKNAADETSPTAEKSSDSSTIDSNKAAMAPLNLDEFRNAIDDVVQDSIQADIENAVEDEVSKKSEK